MRAKKVLFATNATKAAMAAYRVANERKRNFYDMVPPWAEAQGPHT
jgi:hypothetical protein